ncbi:MAG TPA: hypothetical protein VFZ22_21730 [Pyrinomonadaceae bacterium]|nr:hypothetical protein [Pyrinomonadaceae bacterium]
MPNDAELDKVPIDPPDNQGGGNLVAPTSSESDTVLEPDAAPIDPPDNQGGG